MHTRVILLLALAPACISPFADRSFPEDPTHDFDGDGQNELEGDCDDLNAEVYAEAPERCDGVDNDCDAQADEDAIDPTAWYLDNDGDLHGDPQVGFVGCSAAPGFVAAGDDCDDAAVAIHPGQPESCTPWDDNCDGDLTVDASANPPAWHLDRDADGFGDPASEPVLQCEPPLGYVYDDSDCDDYDAGVRPRAVEACDTIDNDCDGRIDDADSDTVGAVLWYTDTDADGFGTTDASVAACAAPAGTSAAPGDCDDARADAFPGAVETCDTTDQDCDGFIDDGVQEVFVVDLDGDGFGDPTGTRVNACAAPGGFVSDASDCDDGDARIYPDADERCDGVDDDCDGDIDEITTTTHPIDALTVYADADGDAFGDPATGAWACAVTTLRVLDATDCDDGRANVRPGGTETCLTVYDDDCDGVTNDPDADACRTWYLDVDRDGYGADDSVCTCVAEGDHDARGRTDCDDATAGANPGAEESCATAGDDDCDGTANEPGAAGCTVYYTDADGDGYGTSASACRCSPGGGYTATRPGDCADSDPARNVASGDCGLTGAVATSGATATSSGGDIYTGGLAEGQAAFEVGDYNGDGVGDLVVGTNGYDHDGMTDVGAAYVFLGPLSGALRLDAATNADVAFTFSAGASSYLGTAVKFGDTNGDGAQEVLVETGSSGTWILPNAAEGYGWIDESFAGVTRVRDTAGYDYLDVWPAGDPDHDGAESLFGKRVGGSIRATLEAGSAGWSPSTSADYGSFRRQLLTLDLDADGVPERLAAYSSGAHCGGSSDSGIEVTQEGAALRCVRYASSLGSTYDSSNYYTRLYALGDLDADGYPDLGIGNHNVNVYSPTLGYIASGGRLAVLDADEIFGASIPSVSTAPRRIEGLTASGYLASDAAAGDVDGDGWDDVIVSNYVSSSQPPRLFYGPIALGTTAPSAASATFPALAFSYPNQGHVAIGDVTGDGLADIVGGNPGSMGLWIFAGQ